MTPGCCREWNDVRSAVTRSCCLNADLAKATRSRSGRVSSLAGWVCFGLLFEKEGVVPTMPLPGISSTGFQALPLPPLQSCCSALSCLWCCSGAGCGMWYNIFHERQDNSHFQCGKAEAALLHRDFDLCVETCPLFRCFLLCRSSASNSKEQMAVETEAGGVTCATAARNML